MNQILKDWFEIDENECRNEAEREFLLALLKHAPEWMEYGLTPLDGMLGRQAMEFSGSPLIVNLDISDHQRRIGLRHLRVDFFGKFLLCGDDPCGILLEDLDPASSDVMSYYSDTATPREFAEVAAKWFKKEMSRVIELHEWTRGEYWCSKYMMADTGKCLSGASSFAKKPSDLGQPDKITVVHPPHHTTKNPE